MSHPTMQTPLNPLALAGLSPYVMKKGEEYLSAQQKLHFEQLLSGWRNHLLKMQKAQMTPLNGDEAINSPDLSDRASQEEALILELRSRDRELQLIQKIERTLQRLQADLFGYCEHCGEEIGIKRLEARPTAVLCLDCKQISEMQKKYLA